MTAPLTERAEPVARDKYVAEVDGHRVRLSNIDRVLFPATGFTKGDLLDYYEAVAPALLPHLRGRPLTMRRFPDGADGEGFWEKRCPEHRPDWVKTAAIWSGSADEEIDYCLLEDTASLIWAANLASIELHTSLASVAGREVPDSVVFDLDPGPPTDVIDCAAIAVLMKDLFLSMGLESLVKTSGSKGLQLYVPLNTEVTYRETSAFARSVARTFEAELPEQAVSKMKKSLRPGKVFIDWSQNSEHKTTVSVYSVRAKEAPSVSTPLGWDELEAGLDAGDRELLNFSPEEVVRRVGRDGDLFGGMLNLEQKLP